MDTHKPVANFSDGSPDDNVPATTVEGQLAAVSAERDRLAAEKADLCDRLLRALEEKKRLIEMLDRFLEQPPGELEVHVGLEKAHPAMKDLALIGMTVRMVSGLPAKVAVLGPMHMHYERVMAAVLQTSRALESAQL